jgi:hypothetical protein
MTDHAHRYIPQYAEATYNGGIIAEFPVTMNFDEFRTEVLHIIQKVRTLRMPSKLYLLVRCEVIHILEGLSEANRVATADSFNGLHEFAIRRDFDVRVRPDQSRKPARKF